MNIIWVFIGDLIIYSMIFIIFTYFLLLLIKGMIKNLYKSKIKEKIILVCVLLFSLIISAIAGYFIYCNIADILFKDFNESVGIVKSISNGKYGTRSIEINNLSFIYPRTLKDSIVIKNKNHKFLYAKRTRKIINIFPTE